LFRYEMQWSIKKINAYRISDSFVICLKLRHDATRYISLLLNSASQSHI